MRKSLYNQVRVLRALTVASRNAAATVNGDTLDLAGSQGAQYRTVLFAVVTGTVTDGSHVVAVEDSDNASSWAAAAPGALSGTLPTIVAANDDTVFEIGLQATRRYARVTVTTSGATTGAVFGAVAALGQPTQTPVIRP